jgi:ribosome modulation factor
MPELTESEKLAWECGFDAYLSGRSETSNPYDDQSDEFASWNDGWLECQLENG